MQPTPVLLFCLASLSLGCGATVSDSGDGGGSPERVAHAEPPLAGRARPGDGPGAVFAISRLFFGDADAAGRRDPDGWRALGFDIDGSDTACDGDGCERVPHCALRAGATAQVFADGDRGIDNAFGARIVDEIFVPLAGGLSRPVDDGLERGESTLLFAIAGLGAGRDYNPLVTRVYRGGDLGRAPTKGGTDVWPVVGDAPPTVFATSFVTDDTWVSGRGELTLALPLYGGRLALRIHHALVTMDLAEDRASATHGTISGILDPEELALEIPRLAGALDPALCRNWGVRQAEREVRRASDILASGEVGGPETPCDGISIGLGFEARRAELGAAVAERPALDPCAD